MNTELNSLMEEYSSLESKMVEISSKNKNPKCISKEQSKIWNEMLNIIDKIIPLVSL